MIITGEVYDDLWIEVDFLSNTHVEGVVTQGRETGGQWVTSYQVKFKKNGQDNFKIVQDDNNQPKVSLEVFIYQIL